MRHLSPLTCLLVLTFTLACGAAFAGVVTVCQCNILASGAGINSKTGNTIRHDFAAWVGQQSISPPLSVIGMEELAGTSACDLIRAELEAATGHIWTYVYNSMGRWYGDSGEAIFWRPDEVESRGSTWYLGATTVGHLDNGYDIKFAGQLLARVGTDEAFGVIAGKLVWADAVLDGHIVTEEDRRQQAVRLKSWILNGEAGSPGMSGYPGTTRIITTDLNTDTGTATWNEMNLDYSDPSSQHTAQSASSPDWWLDLTGVRLDYIWWDYDAGAKQPGGFTFGPERSSYFGSDHRAVYATVNVHPVDLIAPTVALTAPSNGEAVTSPVRVSASASDASGVLKVEFLIDGASIWTDTSAPYEFDWDSSGCAQGYHTIVAVATDASSNRLKTQSQPVVVWTGENGAPTIADAKAHPNGDIVSVQSKLVTASLGTYFYIEEPDRSSGVKVTNGGAPAVGSLVSVMGRMSALNGEREISATSVTVEGAGAAPAPVGMSNEDVGGGPLGQYTGGIYGAKGPNNVGLLVSCWGKVTAIISGYYMYIDDGSHLRDGYGYTGLRIDISGLSGYTPPALGSYVRITGVSTTSVISGKVQRRIKVRVPSDIVAPDWH